MPELEVNGIRLHHVVDGPRDGVPILLSNSLASRLEMWDPQVPALVEAGFRVIRYDSRGHGRSDVPAGPYDIATIAEDAVGILDALDIERAHFCGLSKGGMVGQWVGVNRPERFVSLTLCDTAAHAGPASVWDERIDAVRAGGMAAVADATIERWFTPGGRERLTAAVKVVRDMVLSTPVEGFCASAAAIRDMDQRESIRSITVPTLVIVGEDDPGTPVSAAELIAERIAGAELVVLPEAAHFANVEQAAAFNHALLAFLTRHR